MKPKVAVCSCHLQHGPFLGLQLPHLQLSPMTHPLPQASVTLSAAVTYDIFPPSASVSTPKAASWFSSTWAAVLWLWVPWCRVITLYRASQARLCILYIVFFQLNPWSLSSGSVQAMSTLTPFCMCKECWKGAQNTEKQTHLLCRSKVPRFTRVWGTHSFHSLIHSFNYSFIFYVAFGFFF